VLRISTQVRYGTRALVQIAGVPPGRAVPVKEIARAQRVSMKYLEHIVSSLKHAGLIRAVRGTKGGYVLARAPRSVRLDEVVRALEGPPVVGEGADRPEPGPAGGVWVRIREAVDGVLASVTLQDLVEESRLRGGAPPASYEI
jgi:Rrf2 family cysteine metabolism transcriptional repressor